MPLSVEQLAGALIEHVSSSSARELLFGKATLNSYYGSTLSGPLSKEFALTFYKKSLEKVLVISRDERTDPEVLAKFAKDHRVSVRTALLENPTTPYEAVLSLVQWALKREDWAYLSVGLKRLTVGDLVDFLTREKDTLSNASWVGTSTGYSYYSGIDASALVKLLRSDKEAVLSAIGLGLPTLTEVIALQAHEGKIPGLSISDVMAKMQDDVSRSRIAERVQCASKLLTADIAQYLPRGHHVDAEEVAMCEPEALVAIAPLSQASFRSAIELGLPESDIVAVALDRENPWIRPVASAIDNGERVFSKSFERCFAETLLEKHVNPKTGFLPDESHEIFTSFKHRLPDSLIESLIRAMPYRTLCSWVVFDTVNAARPGQVRRIFESPGLAFHDAKYNQYTGRVAMQEHTRDEIAYQLLRALSLQTMKPELAPDLRYVFDTILVRNLGSNTKAASLVAEATQEAFGDDTELWSTFLVLASDWSGSFTDLLSATAALTGKTLNVKKEAAPKVVSKQPRVEELVLV